MQQTKEQAFEATVESMLLDGGWRKGPVTGWDVERALFPTDVVAFLRATQPREWGQLEALHGQNLDALVVDGLAKELDLKGSLHVLRHGFRFYGKTLRVAYFKPASGLNPDALEQFARNDLTVTRQVPCHPGRHDTVDLLFALNGVPVATCEVKNPWTGQDWRNAVRQYREDRDPRAPVFRFQKRTLVHFAADPDQIHMTTELSGESTRFLPFNRGSHPGAVQCGAGNPAHRSGYRTGYFWQEVLERERFLDILAHYIFVERSEEKVDDGKGGSKLEKRETVIFPRYHQLDSVTRLVETARAESAGQNYLIQHSAGSGKTNSISWLSHRLASLHDTEDRKVFDCVVVITDRRVLDQQLQDAVYQIEHAQGVVKAIDQDSRQLATALIDGTKIVITTLQKFPFVLRGLLHAAGAADLETPTDEERTRQAEWQAAIAARCYAVIVDEAHSSQTGESAREMKAILGAGAAVADGGDEGEADWEDGLNAVVESRGRQPNLSFFAFTATPKGKTLELFGRPGTSGTPEAFHVYSMRQAIEEGFILDVLQNYTTYDTYYRLVKTAEDDPNFPKRRTATALAKFMSLHPHNIEQKTEVILEHFRNHVRHKIAGRAKAMVVTSSRLHAVRYKQAFDRYLEEEGLQDEIRVLVAFSGTVRDPESGDEFTEPGMNRDVVSGRPIGEGALPDRFDSPDYQILIVANKYQTGFDQPLLHTMYVDRRLDGVQAVQTLSRLNRTARGKEAPFVLDFVNDVENIYRAFKPYYDRTELLAPSDPAQLEALRHELDQAQVYHWNEVEAFARIFYVLPAQQRAQDHARLAQHLQPARDRFKALEDVDAQQAFRDRLGAFVKMYAFLSQIIPYGDTELEQLSSFGRLLLPYLHPDRDDATVKLTDEIELEYYRLERVYSGAINLREGPGGYVVSPSEVGTGRPEEERAPLSEIIEQLNEKFGTQFTQEDALFLAQVRERGEKSEYIRQTGNANEFDKFALGIRRAVRQLMVERHADNDAFVTRYLNDTEFEDAVFDGLARELYGAVRADSPFS